MNEANVTIDQGIRPVVVSDVLDDSRFTIGEIIDENELPGMPQLWETVSQQPISQEKIADLRARYYPNFTNDEIVLIEHTMDYSFRKFQLYSKWTYNADVQQPSIADFGLNAQSSLVDRLEVINKLNKAGQTNAAFATLENAESFLAIPDQLGVVDLIDTSPQSNEPYDVVDIGCGGQGADLQLITHNRLTNRDVRVVGVGAYDYGQRLRMGFPELSDKLGFISENIYLGELPESADLVFSVRTLPYTGVIDAVRFCEAAEALCKPDGTVWVADIDNNCFDFRGSKYANLDEYLTSLQEQMPSLSHHADGFQNSVRWNKAEGSPFAELVAKEIKFNDRQQPYLIRYGLKK